MPDWYVNQLTIRGKHDDIKIFLDDFKGYPVSWSDTRDTRKAHKKIDPQYCFNAIIPVPELVRKRGYSREHKAGGYYWCIENWGVKWDVYGQVEVIAEAPEEVILKFPTPWGPPTEFFTEVIELYKDLTFETTVGPFYA